MYITLSAPKAGKLVEKRLLLPDETLLGTFVQAFRKAHGIPSWVSVVITRKQRAYDTRATTRRG